MPTEKTPQSMAPAADPGKTDPSRAYDDKSMKGLPCCPQLDECAACDVLDFPYRLPFRPVVKTAEGRASQVVPVEVTLRFRLERCSGPLALGDLLYTNTLLPGEQVRLFTSDRHSAASFDTESQLAYRQQTTSEESYFMAGMASAMSDLSVLQSASQSSSASGSSLGGGGSAGLDLGIFQIGGSVAASSYDSHAASAFASSLRQHAESSSYHAEAGTRAASSTSIGEVASRTHSQTESQDHYESSSRVFSNPNRCHAVTYFFYRINKCQTLRFELIAIERRVDDPNAPTGVERIPPAPSGGVAIAPNSLLATNKDRLDVESRARASVVAQAEAGARDTAGAGRLSALRMASQVELLAVDLRQAALQQVDAELVAEGLLTKVGGGVSPDAKKRFGWERKLTLPTPGIVVKACLDTCDACEPARDREIELDLEHKQLENELLRKRIELLGTAKDPGEKDATASQP